MEKGKDYNIIFKNGVEYRVLTADFLKRRGFCCSNKCTNCPYSPKYIKGNTVLQENSNSQTY
jgi:hypothetical protein